jgi:hypothetical protein
MWLQFMKHEKKHIARISCKYAAAQYEEVFAVLNRETGKIEIEQYHWPVRYETYLDALHRKNPIPRYELIEISGD